MTTSDRQNSLDTPIQVSRPVIWTFRVVCLIALSISGYLAWTAFNSSEVAGCGGGSVFDCGHVLTSKYAKVLGIPVSVPAFGLYASLLGVLAFMRPNTPPRLLQAGWTVLTVGALAAGLAALWFISIQVFELEHLCSYCLGAHSCGLVLTAIILWKRPLGTFHTGTLSSISMAGVAGLMAIQVNSEAPQTYTVEVYEDEETSVAEAADSSESTFEAPVVFDAPGAESSAAPVFEPPVFEPPVVDKPTEVRAAKPVRIEDPPKPEEEPVTDARDTNPEITSVSREQVVIELADDAAADDAAAEDELDSDSAVDDDSGQPRESSSSVAAAAFLFISPSTARMASRLLAWDETESDEKVAEAQSEEEATPAPAERLVTVAGKRFSLNSRHWPILGDPDAKYIFVEMFDYTCPHCRRTHQTIDDAFEKYGDDLAVIALAVPLEGKCNDTVSSTSSTHRNACELAKIAIAVWRVSPGQFKQFHDWMFERTRSPSEARRYAEELVGKDRLEAELKLPHAESYISRHVDLYKRVGQGSVPKLMFPRSTMTGSVTSSRALISAIERELAR